MEGVLWYVLSGTRGGHNRARILRALNEQPRNTNQLAESLDLDYTTVQHHLGVLENNNVVRNTGGEYGTVYLPTDDCRDNWDIVEEIFAAMETSE